VTSRTPTPGSTQAFADHFSSHASTYARFRPRYPAALFQWLAVVSPGTQLAWDAGTGNGQVAQGLVTRFAKVMATDASAEQIRNAIPHARVTYAVAQYESGLPAGSAQLVTVGQALHWFDADAFCKEARRVLQPQGILAAFAYVHSTITPELDPLMHHHHSVTLGHYWPREHHFIHEEYRTIALPIDELAPPPFEMREEWTLEQYLGFLRSWSATQKLIAARGEEPIVAFEQAFAEAWGSVARRTVRWPMFMRAGEIR
jgi:ubiquinone/menaquinone biosynthesis C-methylase UbiE